MKTFITQQDILRLLTESNPRSTGEVQRLAEDSYGEATRNAVWQHLDRLEKSGLAVKSKSGVQSYWRKAGAQKDEVA